MQLKLNTYPSGVLGWKYRNSGGDFSLMTITMVVDKYFMANICRIHGVWQIRVCQIVFQWSCSWPSYGIQIPWYNVRAVSKPITDIFANNHEYLRNKARGNIFSMLKKLKNSRTVCPKLLIYLFDNLVRPIMTYGAAIWGPDNKGERWWTKYICGSLEPSWGLSKQHRISSLWVNVDYIHPVLQLKQTLSSIWKEFKPYHRSHYLKKSFIEKNKKLHELGFQTLYGRVWELTRKKHIDIETNYSNSDIKLAVKKQFQINWSKHFQKLTPILV